MSNSRISFFEKKLPATASGKATAVNSALPLRNPLAASVANPDGKGAETVGAATPFSYVRAATVQKCGSEIFSVFLCQRCREIWREILVKFSVLRFPGFGRARENFTKISRQKRP